MLRGTISDQRTIARFMKFVKKGDGPDDCWKWTGRCSFSGYGQFSIGGKPCNAHEISYRVFVGPVPDGQEMRHSRPCKCVNPRHITTGTKVQNAQDKVLHGTVPFGIKNGANVLTEEQVRYVRTSAKLVRELAAELGVHQNTIRKIRSGVTWSWLK